MIVILVVNVKRLANGLKKYNEFRESTPTRFKTLSAFKLELACHSVHSYHCEHESHD